MAMGNWKLKKLKQQLSGRGNSTKSKKARIYRAYPPAEGWPGGEPERNGYRRRAG
jgi:hypothetical protein